MTQLCDCADLLRTRRIRNGVICLVAGIALLAFGGSYILDFCRHPAHIGDTHAGLGLWLINLVSHIMRHPVTPVTSLGQFLGLAMVTCLYYMVIVASLAFGWILVQGGAQLLWRALRKEPQQCPLCGSTR